MTKSNLFYLTNEELNLFKYPNLMAEVRETTYSICTIADHMGLSKPYRKEDDVETWNKLIGNSRSFYVVKHLDFLDYLVYLLSTY